MIIPRIYIPDSLKYGIKSKKGGQGRMKIYGADIETVKGEPKLLTLTNELVYDSVIVEKTTKQSIIQKFLYRLYTTVSKGHINIVFFHNLNHDLVALFYQDYSVFRSTNFQVQFTPNITAEIFAGNTWFMSIHFHDIDTRVYVLDSYRFVFTSLANIAKQLKFKHQKIELKGQAKKDLGKKITKEIIHYAKYDTLAELELAQWIMQMHTHYNVKHSVSLPHLASEIFKTKFIPQGKSILQTKGLALNYAIRSYHGGRNGIYIESLPKMVQGVTEIDIISSYPNAMQNLPNFLEGKYVQVDKFDKKHCGVYRVVCSYNSVTYPICFNDDFSSLEQTDKCILYLTSFDIKQAILNKEIKIHSINGIIFIPSESDNTNPLKNYALEFFHLKEETPKTDSRYLIYKLLLNALYGKFFQRTEDVTYELIDGKYHRKSWIKAGGMFQPFIASMITSHARVYLNQLEWKYNSLHSSTDSIKFKGKINEKTLPKGLGGLTKEIYGDCLFFRNKLYIHFNNEKESTENIIRLIERNTIEKFLKINKEEKLIKYALHGFQGNVKQLLEMYKTGKYEYDCKRMVKVREALRTNTKHKALQFIEERRNLHI